MSETPRKRKGDGRRTIKVPRSEAQRQQSRANGAHSKGPRTDAGKAASSENALVHGLSGKMLVPKAHRRTYKARSEAFGQEAGPSALLQGLAGMAALAMTRTEIVCDSRNKAAEKKVRRIHAQARKRQEERLDAALQLWESGRRDEAVAALAAIEEGCRLIAGWWIEAEQAATNVPLGGQFPPAFWEELDTLDPAIPPCYRGYMRKSIAQWRGLDRLPREGFRITIRHVAGFWTAEADRLREASSEDIEERVAHAHADLGGEGQVRHRYLQAAQSLYRQSARQILDERRRHPARSLDLDDPEPPADPPTFEEPDEGPIVGQPPTLDGPDEDVDDDDPSPDEPIDEGEDEDEDWLSAVSSSLGWSQGDTPADGPSAEALEEALSGSASPDASPARSASFEVALCGPAWPDPSPARSASEGIGPSPTGARTGHLLRNTAGVDEGGIPSLALRAGDGSGPGDGPPSQKDAPNSWVCRPDGTVSAVEAPANFVRNEPENSPQPIRNSMVAEISPANRGVDSGLIGVEPTAMDIAPQPGMMRIDFTPDQFRERLLEHARLPGKQVLNVDELMERFRARYTGPAGGGPGGVFDTS